MTATRTLATVLAMLSFVACGRHEPAKDDAPPGQPADASQEQVTHVTGVLGGSSFTLTYGAAKREISGDPRNWICLADVPVTFADCQSSGSPSRTMFLGPFVYDQNGAARWDVAEVGLYRVGANAVTQFARSGTITINADDVSTGALDVTLSVNFGETPLTAGTANVRP